MKTALALLPVLLAVAGCGEDPLAQTAQPASDRAFLYLDDLYFTPCVTAFGPVARGQLFGVAVGKLDASGTSIVDVPATLTITGSDGAPAPIDQVRTSAFRTRFPREGTFVLTATLDDGSTLEQRLEVVEQAGLSLSPLFRKRTTFDANGECSETENTFLFAPEGPAVLSANQTLAAAVVPVDAAGTPLLGHVDVAFSGTMKVEKSTTWLGSNSFTFQPTQTGTHAVRVTDATLRQDSALSFEVSAVDATCPPSD